MNIKKARIYRAFSCALFAYEGWRRHPDLNRGIRVLQTRALPLGYDAEIFYNVLYTQKIFLLQKGKST